MALYSVATKSAYHQNITVESDSNLRATTVTVIKNIDMIY